MANPSAGTYTLSVTQSGYHPSADVSFDLVLNSVGATVLSMDGSSTGHLPRTWQYYRLDITETLGGETVLGLN